MSVALKKNLCRQRKQVAVLDTETCSASLLFCPDHTRALARGLGLALARALALARKVGRALVVFDVG